MKLDEDDATDEVIGMICVNDPERETVLVVSEKGKGKRSVVDDYRVTNRGGKGVKTLNITEDTGNVVAIKAVTEEQDLMIINKSGITIRLRISDVNVQGRATQGTRLIDLKKRNDVISSVCLVPAEEEEEEVPEANTAEAPETITEENTTEPNVPEQGE